MRSSGKAAFVSFPLNPDFALINSYPKTELYRRTETWTGEERKKKYMRGEGASPSPHPRAHNSTIPRLKVDAAKASPLPPPFP